MGTEPRGSFGIILVGIVGAVLAVLHLVTRTSCPPGYVHLVDFSWPVLALSVVVAAFGLVPINLRARLPALVEALVLAGGVLAVLTAAAHLVFLRDTCWTF